MALFDGSNHERATLGDGDDEVTGAGRATVVPAAVGIGGRSGFKTKFEMRLPR
ncbi:hypothetical protein [Devosia sp.]|uniref:hypothetical protein n=1 Tax=Devosia sp. TaxID=1871048 RepID=UPI002635B46C|nr:hypothetical protein [Devosia sp.]